MFKKIACLTGGRADLSFEYIRHNHGIDTEKSYPYTAGKSQAAGDCRFNASNVGATDKGFVTLPHGDEDALALAVAAHGPIAVAISVGPFFQCYRKGILRGDLCGKELNHAVLVVGYGPGYWLVKNSWGKKWGMGGYIKMERGVNMCGIASDAQYPLV